MRLMRRPLLPVLLLLLSAPAQPASAQPTAAAGKVYEPQYGTASRRVFVAALRPVARRAFPRAKLGGVMVGYGYLRVHGDWAFGHANLTARPDDDGVPSDLRYEAVLLRKRSGRWAVVASQRTPQDARVNIDAVTFTRALKPLLKTWRARYPQAPADLFPRDLAWVGYQNMPDEGRL